MASSKGYAFFSTMLVSSEAVWYKTQKKGGSMTDERKYRNLYDVALVVVPLIMVALGIFYLRAPKVAVLNFERVANETGVTDRLRESENQLASATYTRLNELTAKIRTKNTELEAKLAAATGEAAKRLVQEELQRSKMEAQEVAEKARQEFQQFREDVRRDIRAKVEPFVVQIAVHRHLQLVIDSGDGRSVFFARPAADITDEVIKKCGTELTKMDLSPTRISSAKPISSTPKKSATPLDKNSKK
jgi:Skp family chaperone for outer membrane proteins